MSPKNEKLKGALLVGLGASSYGMLATFVKLAYKEGYTLAEVTLSQLALGLLGLGLITLYQSKTRKTALPKIERKDWGKLLLTGSSLGFTSLFYYMSVQYIDVSIGIVLLMQTVWMSVLLEALLTKTFPSGQKIISVLIVLVGTLLATQLIGKDIILDIRGVFWGLMAATSFTTTMYASNKVATYLPSYQKSFVMLLGGFIVIGLYNVFSYNGSFDASIFLKWGIILALFGMIIPPLLLNAGFPKSGLGLGSIMSSLELPVSVMMAFFLLKEQVNSLQWLGIVLIITAIVIMNLNIQKK